MRVIVTRPAAQADAWVDRLRECGVAADALPLIRSAAALDLQPVRDAWQGLVASTPPGPSGTQRPELVMFVSANAVQHFIAARPASILPSGAWPDGVVAAATGPGTAAALRQAGVPERLVEEPRGDNASFDSEGLWRQLAAQPWQGRRALVVRGESGRNWFAEQLRQHGAQVDLVVVYRRLPPLPDAGQQALLDAAVRSPASWLWHFSSSESLANLCALAPDAAWGGARAVATHPRIVQAARSAGFGSVGLIAPTPQAVADWLRHEGAHHEGATDPSIQSAPQ